MKLTLCQCTAAGWCERHQCLKHQSSFEQCQISRDWFDRWERGEGPCIPVPGIGPSLAQRVVNFGTAVIRHAANGLQQVDQATYDARLAICRDCASCDTERMVCRQPVCGCSLTIKARWASEDCPLHQWPGRGAQVREGEGPPEPVAIRAPAEPIPQHEQTLGVRSET